jgi:hypothetical protein
VRKGTGRCGAIIALSTDSSLSKQSYTTCTFRHIHEHANSHAALSHTGHAHWSGNKLDYFLATGNLVSTSGLDLLQVSGYTIVAEKLNIMRYLSHFRSVHRGAFFTEMKTTAVSCSSNGGVGAGVLDRSMHVDVELRMHARPHSLCTHSHTHSHSHTHARTHIHSHSVLVLPVRPGAQAAPGIVGLPVLRAHARRRAVRVAGTPHSAFAFIS